MLYAFGSGPVRGFGVTLAIGILCSMFTSVTVTRLIISTWLHWRRPKELPILTRGQFGWLVFIGLAMAAGTLGVITWAGNEFDETVAHTMGLVTFSMFHLFYSLETSNEERTLFSSELLENPILVKTSLASLLTIFLATTFGPLQGILDTAELDVSQWAICVAVGASILVIAEIRKFVRRRSGPQTAPGVPTTAPASPAAA